MESAFINRYLTQLDRKVFSNFKIEYSVSGETCLILTDDEALIFYREYFLFLLSEIHQLKGGFTNLSSLEQLDQEFNNTQQIAYISLASKTLLVEPRFVKKLRQHYNALNHSQRTIFLYNWKLSKFNYCLALFTYMIYLVYTGLR
jgi:hypothetical protein